MGTYGLPRRIQLAVLAATVSTSVSVRADEPGIHAGSRLFVTKVYPEHGALTAADFQQLADAGFTVVVNRWIYGNNGRPVIDEYIQGAATAGLDAAAWRGGLADATQANDQTVTYEGKTTRYVLPYSAQGWNQITQEVVSLAQKSLASPNFKAALLDFEIYDPNKTNGFAESYDDSSFDDFFRQRGTSTPQVAVSQRRDWLKNRGLLDDYIALQANYVGERARQLRQAVDQVNPEFQIGVYGWGPLTDAVKENVATAAAPVLDLNAETYGRTRYSNAFAGGYDADAPDRASLKWALITNAQAAQQARRRDYPAIFLGGHYPQSPRPDDGRQYQFTARQAFNSAVYADGYWIWTDLQPPKPFESPQAWLDEMMSYFARANAAVVQGDWTWASRQPVQVEDPNATQAIVVLTLDEAGNVAAWNAVSGRQLATNSASPKEGWVAEIHGDVDTAPDDEKVFLKKRLARNRRPRIRCCHSAILRRKNVHKIPADLA